MSNQTFSDKAGVIIFPPLLYAITLTAGLLSAYFFPYYLLSLPVAIPGGALLSLIAFFTLRKAVKSLAKHKTTINPNGATTTIVKEGIYKFSRNPMYLSFTLFYMGIAVMFNAWLGVILVIPLLIIVQKGIIEQEEKYLIRKFGNEYLTYKSKVRRWL